MQKARQMVSEYISKEELKDYLEKNISFGGTEKKFRFYDMIDSLPSAFEGMTNVEVIKAMFPNLKYTRGDGFTMIEADNHATRILIWDSFGDSPYKGVSE